MAKTPVLTAFASGRATALVVDCGAGGTTVTAVHDGYALRKAVTRSPLGGDALTSVVLKYLEKVKKVPVKPRYEFTRTVGADGETTDVSDVKGLGHTTPAYRLHKQMEIAADVKETSCRVSDKKFNADDFKNVPSVAYELPDGTVVELGAERFKIPELLFDPDCVETLGLPASDVPDWRMPDGSPLKGLAEIILDTINACDVDARRPVRWRRHRGGGRSSRGCASATVGAARSRADQRARQGDRLGEHRRAQVQHVDRRLDPGVVGVVPADVALQGGVRRARRGADPQAVPVKTVFTRRDAGTDADRRRRRTVVFFPERKTTNAYDAYAASRETHECRRTRVTFKRASAPGVMRERL